jgi:divalent metal cation (Fe/Co/Zn/Cd) transporter
MTEAAALLRRGRRLEGATLAWNVIAIGVLALAAIRARSVALGGFGLDSLIEIGASTVVLWELADSHQRRQHTALRLIGVAFAALGAYLAVQSTVLLVLGAKPGHSPLGIAWVALTAAVMFVLAAGKAKTGRALGNLVLQTEGRVTTIDGILACAVLVGLVLNAVAGWWWADPAAAYVLVYYSAKEAHHLLTDDATTAPAVPSGTGPEDARTPTHASDAGVAGDPRKG